MYLNISRADGPVGTYKFLNTLGSYLLRYLIKPYKKSSISALLVGKPFFFFLLSAFLTFGFREREYVLKARAIVSDKAIYFKVYMRRLFMTIVATVYNF